MPCRRALPILILVLTVACSSGTSGDDGEGTWVGTVTTEGDVTTVVNESGSVWGGPATLVEELSIGVEAGEDPYMFGPIAGLAATDGRIFVGDDLAFTVRVYDRDGQHLFDVGREGQGPGEFDHIEDVAVDPDGRLLVQSLARITVFDLDGNLLDTWSHRRASGPSMTIASDGTAYVSTARVVDEERFVGLVALARDGSEVGTVAAPSYDPVPWGLMAEANGRRRGSRVLYAPVPVWAALPSNAAVQGVSDTYRFSVQRPDGDTMVIERYRLVLPDNGDDPS